MRFQSCIPRAAGLREATEPGRSDQIGISALNGASTEGSDPSATTLDRFIVFESC